MCLSDTPDIPKPQAPQEIKQPEMVDPKKRKPVPSGTLLTGPSGIANSALNLGGAGGATTVLGG
jgi:hypothetical protein